jgi:hypothetical protein
MRLLRWARGGQAPVTVRCHGQQRALGSGQSLQFTL